MSNLKLLGLYSLLAKATIVGTLYYTVFANSTLAGIIILAAHGVYELSGYYLDREVYKLQVEEATRVAELVNKRMGGGSC